MLIYSKSSKRWLEGVINEIILKNNCTEEWLEIYYKCNNRSLSKQIQRTSIHIKPLQSIDKTSNATCERSQSIFTSDYSETTRNTSTNGSSRTWKSNWFNNSTYQHEQDSNYKYSMLINETKKQKSDGGYKYNDDDDAIPNSPHLNSTSYESPIFENVKPNNDNINYTSLFCNPRIDHDRYRDRHELQSPARLTQRSERSQESNLNKLNSNGNINYNYNQYNDNYNNINNSINSNNNGNENNLYVCRLPISYTVEDIGRLFSQCGIVDKVHIIGHRESIQNGKLLAAFVRFKFARDAFTAVNKFHYTHPTLEFKTPMFVKYAERDQLSINMCICIYCACC